MNRRQQMILLTAAGAVLVAVAFFFLVWQPKQEEITRLEEETEAVETEQAQLRSRIATLEETRDRAPEIEAAIVASQSIVPRDIALPSALRQLQLAADESGVELVSIAPSRPAQMEGAGPGLTSIDLGLQLTGGYFQVVDFLRRVEDPTVTPRGFVWGSLSLAPAEYPELSAAITGRMFAQLPAPPAAAPEEEQDRPQGQDGGGEEQPADGESPGGEITR